MPKKIREQISSMELFSTTCVFVASTPMILLIGSISGHNSWISIIMGTIIGLGFAWVYTSLCDSHPGKSIIEIGELLIGRWPGKIIGLVYFWVSFQLSALVMTDHWKFTRAVALPTTPIIVVAGTMMLLVLWITYAGIEVIVRVSTVLFPMIIISILVALTLLIKDMNFKNMFPILYGKERETMYGGFQISTLPFGEAVLFAMVFPHLRKKRESRIPSFIAILTAGLLILTLNVTNILVLGDLRSKFTYPPYAAFSYIQAADFIDRAEIIIYTLFTSVIFIKMAVTFYVAAVSLAKVLNVKDHRFFLFPLGFLVVELSTFIYKSHAEVGDWVTYVWPWYSICFIFLIPLLLLVITKVRKRRIKSV